MMKITLFEKTLPKNYVRKFFQDNKRLQEFVKGYRLCGRWSVRGLLEEDDGTYSFQCELMDGTGETFFEFGGLTSEDLYSNEEGFMEFIKRLFDEIQAKDPDTEKVSNRLGIVFV